MNALQSTVYYRSPPWLQSVLASAARLVARPLEYGLPFAHFADLLRSTEEWSRDRLDAWQFERLKAVVSHAFANVPGYRDLYQQHGVSPEDLKAPSDLSRFPTVNKQLFRAAGKRFRTVHAWRHGPVRLHTSGTTGTPFQFLSDYHTECAERALVHRHRRWIGIPNDAWIASLGGRMIVPRGQQDPPFWRRDYVDRLLWLSAFHMTPEVIDLYVDLLCRQHVRFVKGYPSNLHIFASHMLARGARLSMGGVITGSEPLLPHVRRLLEDRLGCGVSDWYGISERAAGASQCKRRAGYHVHAETCLVEIVPLDGASGTHGCQGEIVGTSLVNYAMPFIRYRTGDLTSWAEDCPCGLPHRCIAGVETKSEDVIYTSDGRWLSPSALTHPFKPIKGVELSQVEQVTPTRMIIRIVGTTAFDDAQQALLVAGIRERVGGGTQIDVERVQEISRGSTGKFRWVISHVGGHQHGQETNPS